MNNENRVVLNKITPRPVFRFNFSTLMLFRCIRRDRAEQLRKGEIYFGSPQQWIEEGKKGNQGQGDVLEGVFLSTQINDDSDFIKQLKVDPIYEHFNHEGYTFFRRKSVVDLRCLCLYGLRDNSFQKEISPDGRAHYKACISKNYFSAFTTLLTREEYNNTAPEKQPVVIFIKEPHVFFTRICAFLASLGVKKEEIIISPVEYLDRHTRMIANLPSPHELLLKDSVFDNQSEVRIIINSNSPQYLDYMRTHNYTIKANSLEDITEIYDYYFDNMTIERWSSKSMLFSLPESKTFDIQNMGFFELEDLVTNILRGTVTITGYIGEDSWDAKLKPIADLFYAKYGVVLHVDDNKNVFLYNLPQDLLCQFRERNKHWENIAQFERNTQDLIDEGRLTEALSICLSSSEDKQLLGPANFYLGKIYAIQHLFQDAENAFHSSFQNDYKRIESLYGIAEVLFRQEKYDKAIEVFNSIQDEKGYDGRIWCNIGICYIRLKQYDKAIEYFNKAILYNNEDSFPFYNKGVALYMLKQFDQSKECMERAIELSPNNDMYRSEYMKCFPNI